MFSKDLNEVVGELTAKVNRLSTGSKQQKTIKSLEQHRRRLMNRAQDRLSTSRKLLNKITNRPTSLRIQPTSRLIQKHQQLWSSSQLDTNRQSFPLLDVQTLTRRSDNSV